MPAGNNGSHAIGVEVVSGWHLSAQSVFRFEPESLGPAIWLWV